MNTEKPSTVISRVMDLIFMRLTMAQPCAWRQWGVVPSMLGHRLGDDCQDLLQSPPQVSGEYLHYTIN